MIGFKKKKRKEEELIMKKVQEKENKLFIVHWQYNRYQGEYQKSHDYIDKKELFEAENKPSFVKNLKWTLETRGLKQDDIESIRLVTKTRLIRL